MKKLITLVFILSFSFAQQTWTKVYGGTDHDMGFSAQQTSDGGYIICGSTYSFGAGNGDVCLIKTDAYGDTLWIQTYGGTETEGGWCVQQAQDGGYIVVGYTYSFGSGNSDIYLIKTDSNGDTIWTKTFGGGHLELGESVQLTSDSGYIIVGYTESFGINNNGDVYLIKTNAFGDRIWDRTYGGEGYDASSDVQPTSDGGYVIVGCTQSYGAGIVDVYLIKTNASGDTVWTKTFGGINYDGGISVRQTSDGGYIVVGFIGIRLGDNDVYLIKTDSLGDTIWTRTYGGTYYDIGYAVLQTFDSCYIVVGSTDSTGIGENDVYLININASGDTLWTRIHGGTGDDEGKDIRQTSDNGYIITGYTTSFGAGDRDFYIIKTDANGNAGVEEGNIRTKGLKITLKVMPNPFTSFARIPGYEKKDFTLLDITGRMVRKYKGAKIGENLPAGVYFLISQDKNINPVRIVKVR